MVFIHNIKIGPNIILITITFNIWAYHEKIFHTINLQWTSFLLIFHYPFLNSAKPFNKIQKETTLQSYMFFTTLHENQLFFSISIFSGWLS